MDIRLAGVIKQSVVDGPGIRFVIFAQGCKHNCKGCQNPQTHPLNGGYISSTENIIKEIKKNPLIFGVTFSGGEPFLQAEKFAYLSNEIHKMELNVITYTGFTIEYLLNNIDCKGYKDLLLGTDILIDGKFILEEKSMMLKFRGSKNQRIIDSKQSVLKNKVIEKDDFYF